MSNQLANDCRVAAEVMEHHGTFPSGQGILRDAAKALEVKDLTLAEMSEKLLRTERNRDMWKGQVERQSAKISNMRAALTDLYSLISEQPVMSVADKDYHKILNATALMECKP